ncbi:DNA alkylation repair protein [Gordonia sp. HY442]|uniref:DNA alkylation repair protein n=1 Tax=Gordonia zhenghanii TaxID=2911516 RepID=UPI001F1D8523|nr:DNA alkylation repair protein [Gordonia zhenghanii]MCF8605343.1 DNA alkylation repair protein [Gordonia zhenghanii]
MLDAAASAADIVAALVDLGDPDRAARSRSFFKTGPGEYGEGDEFVGIRVPELRKLAGRLRGLPAATITELLDSPLHEARLLALLTLTANFVARDSDQAFWVAQYRGAVRAGRVNNWDLVDCSADPILGAYLLAAGDFSELLDWASAEDLWQRRVGIVGTAAFINAGRPDAILGVAPLVVGDRRDLIQKALGWMLREAGKRVDRAVLTDYLDGHAAQMGRTALSYAVEHLSPEERARYRAMR